MASSGGCGGLEAQPEPQVKNLCPPWDVLVSQEEKVASPPHGVHLQGCAGVSQRPGPSGGVAALRAHR